MNRGARPRHCQGLAIAVVLLLLPAAAFAQSCDPQALAMTLRAGTMPDMHGCPRAVVEQALRASEIRSAFATGPSDVVAGVVYDQAPAPGSVMQPGMSARIRVSDGSTATGGAATDSAASNGAVGNSAADGAVAGAGAGAPAVMDSAPFPVSADATQPDTTATDATATDSAPSDPDIADAAPVADAPDDGASAGDTMTGSAISGEVAPGAPIAGAATDGIATNGIATNGIGTDGVAAPGASEPGNVPGLVATPAGAQAIVPATGQQASTSIPVRVAAMPGWWWIALALALALILAGVMALLRQRRAHWQRPAWEQRVHALGVIVPQGNAMPVGEIPFAAMPFSVAASLGVGEIAVIGDIPTRTQDA